MLTDSQAETVYNIYSGWGLDGTFTAKEVYPERTNRDNGGRRTVFKLFTKKLIELVSEHPQSGRDGVWLNGSFFRYRLTAQALEEFETYAVSLDYQFPW